MTSARTESTGEGIVTRAIRACDIDLEENEVRNATLKHRNGHWSAVPLPEDFVHAAGLVHRLRSR